MLNDTNGKEINIEIEAQKYCDRPLFVTVQITYFVLNFALLSNIKIRNI